MTFRRRIALLAGLSFAAAVVACSAVGYLTVRAQMLEQIDEDLRTRVATDPGAVEELRDAGPGGPGSLQSGPGREPFRPTDVLFQQVDASGEVEIPPGQTYELPVDDRDLLIAQAPVRTSSLRDVTVDGDRFRMITAATGGGTAVQIARPLAEVESTLTQFARASIAVSLVGSILAAAVGWWVARRSARPVRDLTVAAEQVANTLTLDAPEVQAVVRASHGDDEIGRLATSISFMLEALDSSRAQQQQLVMDASHELRTPLTSLRANVEMLQRSDVDAATRAELLAAVRGELGELTDLATELVELATDTREAEPVADVDMVLLAERVVERARSRSSHPISVEVVDGGWTISGRPAQLERMLANLVDNAAKFSPPEAPIVVEVSPSSLSVRDHGPGVPDEDRALVFQRFFRSDVARATPGSGLGLAIVDQIVRSHDGSIEVANCPGGGAIFTVRLADGDRPLGLQHA